MKFKINKYVYIFGYYISFGKYQHDTDIAIELDILFEDYQRILIKHNARLLSGFREYCFNNQQDAQSAITELEPYLIMKKLTED